MAVGAGDLHAGAGPREHLPACRQLEKMICVRPH